MIEVSVIITVYNYQCDEKIEVVFKGWRQQTINTEVILCEQSVESNLQFVEMCKKYDVQYLHCKPDEINGEIKYNIGRVRNIAALCSRGKYLYFSDADIVVTNLNYLEILVKHAKIHDNVPLMRPFFRRLIECDTNKFCNSFLHDESRICFNAKEYFCNSEFDSNSETIKKLSCGERYRMINNVPYVSRKDYYDKVNSGLENVEKNFDCWQPAMHYGGLFCLFENFEKVGGYSEKYYNWGYEDIDLQWKFDEIVGIQIMDAAIKECSLIHFEHPSRRRNKQYIENTNTFKARKKIGQKRAIRDDINSNNSFIAAYMRNDKNEMSSLGVFDNIDKVRVKKCGRTIR